MKLFKSLLVAPAALGLLTPIAANASDVNLNEVSNYSREFEINSTTFVNPSSESTLLAGGEGMVDEHDGGFSEQQQHHFQLTLRLDTKMAQTLAIPLEHTTVSKLTLIQVLPVKIL